MLNVGTVTFWFRNRATGLSLTVLDDQLGSGVVERSYTGLPHQNWRLLVLSDAYRLLNTYSGLVLELGVDETTGQPRLIQATPSASSSQRWSFRKEAPFPKKGMANWLHRATLFQPAWGYNWNGEDGTLSDGGWQFPVQQNAWWPGWGRIPWKYVYYNARVRPDHHFTFNEPDHADQANMTVAQAVSLWPRLERLHVPLVSPAPATYGSWIRDFMQQAVDQRGYRVDYMAVHWYGNPKGGNPQGFINWLRRIYDTYQRPLILNEFSTVDWSGDARWTEEDNYNFFAEFFWRAEDLDWLNKYAPFLFHGSVPANPWDPTAPRGNWMDGNRPTAIGELFAAWDGDRTIHERTPYILHSQGTRKRLKNAGRYRLQPGTIRESGPEMQFALVSAGQGRFRIVSLADGARLWSNGVTVGLVPPGMEGAEVEWQIVSAGHGWHYLQHAASGRRLRFYDVLEDGTTHPAGIRIGIAAAGASNSETRFFLVKPWQPVSVEPPAPPPSLTAAWRGSHVEISWSESPSSDRWAYHLRRRLEPDGEWTVLKAVTTTRSFADEAVLGGHRYTYEVRTIDWTGLESGPRRAVVSVPPKPPVTYSEWAAERFGSEPTGQADPGGDPDGDGRPNIWEYVFATDPLASEPSPLNLQLGEGGRLRLRRRFNPTMRDFRVTYEFTEQLGRNADWKPVTAVEAVVGPDPAELVVELPDFGTATGFYRLRLEPVQGP